MPTTAPDIGGGFHNFPEAVRYFQEKVNLPTQRWNDLWQGQHARAFVIAGATRDDLLADFRSAVDAAIAQGESLEQFRARFDDIVGRHGWQYNGSRNWRSSVIYQTNLRTAYMAGRWETLKAFPYLRYQHNTVAHPREQHKGWDALILRRDDPWWDTHYPPNGWGCRCSVTGISAARMRVLGKSGPDPTPGAGAGDPPPEWAYHVGKAASGRPVDPRLIAAEAGGRMTTLDLRGPAFFQRPETVPFDVPMATPATVAYTPEALRQAFRSAIGGESARFRDPAGDWIEVGDSVIRHWLDDMKRVQGREQYLPLLPEVIQQPFEIWAGFARNELTGKVSLRRRYVKGAQVGKDRYLGLVADAIDGQWLAFNFFVGGKTALNNLRIGHLLWGRP